MYWIRGLEKCYINYGPGGLGPAQGPPKLEHFTRSVMAPLALLSLKLKYIKPQIENKYLLLIINIPIT